MNSLVRKLAVYSFLTLLPSLGFSGECDDFRKAKLDECGTKWKAAKLCTLCKKKNGKNCSSEKACGASSSETMAKAEECTQAAKKVVDSSKGKALSMEEQAACDLLDGSLMLFGDPNIPPTDGNLMKTPITRKAGPTLQSTPIQRKLNP